MIPQRLSVKFFAPSNNAVNLDPFVPLFHSWIQNHTVEGLLVDVARYEHVPEGPGVILIAHEVDYGLDLTAGKPGLLVRRKRYEGAADLAEVIRDTLRKAVIAALALQADGSTGVQLDAGTVEITLIDRLQTPNTAVAYDAVTPLVKQVLSDLYPDGFELRSGSDDPRTCLSLIATSTAPAEFKSALSRLRNSG
jgi:hypothetical protein